VGNNIYIIEFYKNFGRVPRLGHFQFEDPFVIAFKKPPKEALKWLKNRAKNQKISTNWDDLDSVAHDKAWTVAKVMSADVLQDVYDYVDGAKKEGWTFEKFKKKAMDGGLVERMQEAGWTGKNASRLKVIYDTNMQMAFGHQQFKQLKLIAEIKPYWKYTQIQRPTKRHDHSLLDGKVFRHDDPIWNTIFPPSGFGCKCTVVPTKDGTGVEDGEKYIEQFKDSPDFGLRPLEAWEPDMKKYVNGIAKALKAALPAQKPEKAPEINLSLLR
jgi:SPP1 gp7 family putative phage head morphogenesis protein